jgi:hypothetical protein
MSKVIMTAQVQDGVKWEKNFRTHADIFRTYGLRAPVDYCVKGNDVTICVEPADAAAFLKTMEQQPTIDAMKMDGVKRETVKVYVLDRRWNVEGTQTAGA